MSRVGRLKSNFLFVVCGALRSGMNDPIEDANNVVGHPFRRQGSRKLWQEIHVTHATSL